MTKGQKADVTKDRPDVKNLAVNLSWHIKDGGNGAVQHCFHPIAYNVGVNVGAATGQSVFHTHIHVIPRYEGDISNPLDGVRNVKKSIVQF